TGRDPNLWPIGWPENRDQQRKAVRLRFSSQGKAIRDDADHAKDPGDRVNPGEGSTVVLGSPAPAATKASVKWTPRRSRRSSQSRRYTTSSAWDRSLPEGQA